MRFTTLFFDLDDTLYPNSAGLWKAIKERMNLYMHNRMGIPEAQVPQLREQYFKMYGTTLRGLQARHKVDTEDYLAFVHDLPLKDFLAPDPTQREIIASPEKACSRLSCTAPWSSHHRLPFRAPRSGTARHSTAAADS